MQCPFCFSNNVKCIDSRDTGSSRRRRYECNKCRLRFSTKEIYVDLPENAEPTTPREETPKARKTRKPKEKKDDGVESEHDGEKKSKPVLKMVEISEYGITVRTISKEKFRKRLTNEMKAHKRCDKYEEDLRGGSNGKAD